MCQTIRYRLPVMRQQRFSPREINLLHKQVGQLVANLQGLARSQFVLSGKTSGGRTVPTMEIALQRQFPTDDDGKPVKLIHKRMLLVSGKEETSRSLLDRRY